MFVSTISLQIDKKKPRKQHASWDLLTIVTKVRNLSFIYMDADSRITPFNQELQEVIFFLDLVTQ